MATFACENGTKVHIPGIRDLIFESILVLGYSCPLPTANSEKRRKSSYKKNLFIHAPMSNVGGVMYDQEAIWVNVPGIFTRGNMDGKLTIVVSVFQQLEKMPTQSLKGEGEQIVWTSKTLMPHSKTAWRGVTSSPFWYILQTASNVTGGEDHDKDDDEDEDADASGSEDEDEARADRQTAHSRFSINQKESVQISNTRRDNNSRRGRARDSVRLDEDKDQDIASD